MHVSSSDSNGVPAKRKKEEENKEEILEMMENTDNPLRCPVRLYEFYLSKWWVRAGDLSSTDHAYVPLVTCWPLFPLSVRSWWSSAPTFSTFTPSAAACLTLHCGSPPPLWTTTPWRPCSPAFSPSESCTPGAREADAQQCRTRRFYQTRRKRRIPIEEPKWPFFYRDDIKAESVRVVLRKV